MKHIHLWERVLFLFIIVIFMTSFITPSVLAEDDPDPSPSVEPSESPDPTEEPSPSPDPSDEPSLSPDPSDEPSPSPDPTEEPSPSPDPSDEPTESPGASEEPTESPEASEEPTESPEASEEPTESTEASEEPDYKNLFEGFTTAAINSLDLDAAANQRRLIITYKNKVPGICTLSQIDQQYLIKRDKIASDIETISFGEDVDLNSIIANLKKLSFVQYVDIDYTRKLSETEYTATATNDTYYNQAWWIGNTNTEDAWREYTPQSNKQVVVAVIDTGCQVGHPDLRGRIASGAKKFSNSSKSGVTDTDGHGTFCTGEIVAQTNNSRGVPSITKNYRVKVLPLKVFNDSNIAYDSWIISAINYAISKKVNVISMSLGSTYRSQALQAACTRAYRAGITVVAASGNEYQYGNPVCYPAAFANVISVGAYDSSNNIASFSTRNNKVDISAPGVNIVSTLPYNSYAFADGTSMACPLVAGACALLKLQDYSRSPATIETILKNKATDRGASGYDTAFGYGALNLYKAIKTGDDYGNVFATAATLRTARRGKIEKTSDVDMFKFVPTQTRYYTFYSTGSTNVKAYLYNSSANRLAYDLDSGSGKNFNIRRRLVAGQTYYIRVQRQSGRTGVYFIRTR